MLGLFTAQVLAQDAGCPCLTTTSYHTGSSLSFTLSGTTYSYPSTYGLATCDTHDSGLLPYCNADSAPEWCADSWCYVDAATCGSAFSTSVYFDGLAYSYFTCGSANTFNAWFGDAEGGGEAGSGYSLTDLVTLMHEYTESVSSTLEDNFFEAAAASGCAPTSSCPCTDCVTPSAAWDPVTSPDKTTPGMSLSTTTYKQRPGTSTTDADATTDQCLAGILTSSFTRIAAKESDAERIGYEYYGSQALGNYVQWPGMEDCAPYDPRYRPWYAAAASGPKDVVIVVDTSGSMAGTRNALAQQAATMVIDTLTESDYVSVVRFSSSASSYADTLVNATDANKQDIKVWIADNIDASGSTDFSSAFAKTWEVLDATETSSGCNRVVLFLSDGIPDSATWTGSSAGDVAAKAASYSPPLHVLTYALGNGADSTKLKEIACAADGVFYQSADDDPLADIMAGYYQILAPMVEPCKLRWVRYADYYTGTELLGACLASFEKDSAAADTSCDGGLAGLGETGDPRVPQLIGVGCVDMNLVVDLPTLEAHGEWDAFWSLVQAEQTECPRLSLTEAQMETLRAAVGDYSVCDPASLVRPPPPPPPPPAPAPPPPPDCPPAPPGTESACVTEESTSLSAIAGAAVAVLVLFGLVYVFAVQQRRRRSKPSARAPPAATPYGGRNVVQMQPQQPLPTAVGQPVVVQGGPTAYGYGAAAQGGPAAYGYGAVAVPAAVPMGQPVVGAGCYPKV